MEQEPEIKRDQTWIRVQKKTFTRWCNNFLKDRKMFIQELENDLATGIILINLLEIISDKPIGGRYNKNPKMKPQKLENISLALKFIANQRIKLVGIGPEDIEGGNLKLILGLIWTLILRFQIQRGGFEGKAELLEWVRKQVAPYGQKPNNFNLDWKDGKTLSALCDSLKPGVFPQDTWTGDALQDLTTAEDTAEKEYQIPKLLDPEDIAECPDELAMMTYISYYRDWAMDDLKRRAAEIEAERLRKMKTADPSQCYAHGPGVEGGFSNNEAPFKIQAVNYFGDNLPTGGDEFVIELTSPSGEPISVSRQDNQDGTHDCCYKPTELGKYNLAISLRDSPIKNSPYSPVINGPNASHSTASGPGVEGSRINQPAPFTVQSKDSNGKDVPTGGDDFSAKVFGPDGNPLLCQFNDTKDGKYQAEYTPTKPGRYTVEVALGGEPIQGSPFQPLMENANAGNSWAEGPGLVAGQTKKPCEFTIHAVDADGNPVNNGESDPFEVSISGPEAVEPQVTDNKDGTYAVVYSVETPGDYQVDVKLHGDNIKDAPFHPHIKWSCDPSQCFAHGPGLEEVFDNKPTGFTIQAVDYDGNNRIDGGDPFVCKITSDSEGDVPVQLVDNNDGTYSVSYATDKPGNLQIEVTLEEQPIKDTPVSIESKAGTDHSSTGFGGFTFNIQTRDKRGDNKLFGGDDFAVLCSTHPDVEVSTKDNNNGTYSASFNVTEKGNYSFQILFNGQELGCSPLNMNL